MMQARDRAGLYGREHEPDVDELRGVLRKALPRPVNRLRWALQAGCTLEHLEAVIEGREDPDDRVLDNLSMVWVPSRGVYADPLHDREARVLQQMRWKEELRDRRSPQPPQPALQRIARPPGPGPRPSTCLRSASPPRRPTKKSERNGSLNP